MVALVENHPWNPAQPPAKRAPGRPQFSLQSLCPLPISFAIDPCLLPLAYWLLPIAYWLLPIADCPPLPIGYCLLPMALHVARPSLTTILHPEALALSRTILWGTLVIASYTRLKRYEDLSTPSKPKTKKVTRTLNSSSCCDTSREIRLFAPLRLSLSLRPLILPSGRRGGPGRKGLARVFAVC